MIESGFKRFEGGEGEVRNSWVQACLGLASLGLVLARVSHRR